MEILRPLYWYKYYQQDRDKLSRASKRYEDRIMATYLVPNRQKELGFVYKKTKRKAV